MRGLSRSGTLPLVCTVSTVKDTLANVEAFVTRNLSAGADHMFVMLDAPDRPVERFLSEHPHVTCVVTDRAYWHGRRHPHLNVRQTANANLVRVLLTPFERVGWLFHIDGDECLDVDKERLCRLGPEVPAVHLGVLEAVSGESRKWDGVFKRSLSFEELCLLHALGILDDPRNRSYFNGYATGKGGIRPSLDYNVRIHAAKLDDGTVVKAFSADYLHVLHYESFSAEEFVRKWSTHIAGPAQSVFGQKKQRLRAAIEAVLRSDSLTEAGRQHYLLELYRRNVADAAETLDDLGLLVRPAAEHHSYTPRGFSPDEAADLELLLTRLVKADRGFFRPAVLAKQPADLLRATRADLPRGASGLADRIDATLAGVRRR